MIQETRGRKRKHNFDFYKGEVREYPAEVCNLIRPALNKWIKINAPLWKFKSCVLDGKLLIQRVK